MEYNVSDSKELVFNKLLNILVEFDRVCSENHLKYSLHGGTLIGAIRHKGFIPWDDDVDILMPRESYDKFYDLCLKGVLKSPYFMQSPETDEGSSRMFLRIRDSLTTSISNSDVLYKMNHGMFIDVFPFDYFPNGSIKRKLYITKLTIIDKLAGGYSRFYAGIGCKNESVLKKLEYYFLYPFYKTGVITAKTMFKKFNKVASKYSGDKCDEMADSLWLVYDNTYHYPKDIIEKGFITASFEGQPLQILKEYDRILTMTYGDYMTPKQEPTSHGELIQKVGIPYDEFIDKYKEELIKNWKKD